MNLMDSPTLQLLRPESRPYLGYLAWMIRNGDPSIKDSEPEAPTEVVPELAPDSTQAGQSIAEPGVDYNLIGLWSTDPIPTLTSSSSSPVPSASLPVILIPSPSLVTTSPLDPSAPLVSCSSSALPPPLTSCSSSSAPRAPRPPARLEAESPATPRASRPTPPPRPVALTSTHHSFITSVVRLPGSSAGLARHSRSAFSDRRPAAATDFRDSGCALTLHP
ncbi:hypothetical protein PO909_011550 [Leuciscus waleckii]